MQITESPIAVIGAGAWGSALAITLARKHQTVYLWDRDVALLETMIQERCNTRYLPDVLLPPTIKVVKTLEDALKDVQDILLVVPSHGFKRVLESIKPLLRSHRVVWATKGLDPETGDFLDRTAEQVVGQSVPFAVLSGPSFAKEVGIGLPTAVSIASKNPIFADNLVERFNQPHFSVYKTDDMVGVQLGGVVKNVLAVAIGLSDGVQFGANAKAALMTLGLAEMMRLGAVLGAKPETLMGLAGCGDMILTCTDNQSRNRRFGLALAEGLTVDKALERIGQVVEAVYNVDQLLALAKQKGIDVPIVEQVFRIIKQGVSPKEALAALFERVPERESLTN